MAQHQNSKGQLATDRGKKIQKGGYHAAKEKGGKRKIYFTVGGIGTKDNSGAKTSSTWSPGGRSKKRARSKQSVL